MNGDSAYTENQLGQQATNGPAIVKVTPTGDWSVLAGSRNAQTRAVTGGTGSAARFLSPHIVGIDFDDNVYVLDKPDIPRKVTPAGVVTTLRELPASLHADMNGNRYSFDVPPGKLMRTSPDGVQSEETSIPHCTTPAVEGEWPRKCHRGPFNIILISGSSYVMIDNYGISRIVLPH